jgi:hypothetical protein
LPEQQQALPVGHYGARQKCCKCHEMNDHNRQRYIWRERHDVTLDPTGAEKRENVGLSRVKKPHLQGIGAIFGAM